MKKYVEKFNYKDTNDDIYVRDIEANESISKIINTDIPDLEKKIDGLNADVGNNTTNINELNKNVSNLSINLNSLNRNFDSLNNYITSKVIILMDSYGANYDQNWLSDLGWKLFWKAGSGFDTANSTNFNLWGIDSIIGLGADALKTFDRIIILGGFNDRNSSIESITAGIKQFRTRLASELLKLGIDINRFKLNVGHIGWSSTVSSSERDKMFSASIPAYKRCFYTYFGYIENSEYTFRPYNLFGDDNIHPTASGCAHLHHCIKNYVASGTWGTGDGYNTVSFKGVGTNGTHNIGWWIHGSMCEMYLPYNTIDFDTPKLLKADTATMLLQVSYNKNTPFMGMFDNSYNVQHCINLSGYFTVSSGGTSAFISMEGMKFWIQGGFLYCMPNGLNKDKTGFDTGYVSSMQIRSGSVTVPLMLV